MGWHEQIHTGSSRTRGRDGGRGGGVGRVEVVRGKGERIARRGWKSYAAFGK